MPAAVGSELEENPVGESPIEAILSISSNLEIAPYPKHRPAKLIV